ncbi:acetylglutamate kinase [Halalkalibacter sp. APA_J-10(15)]|uniref:acetylglutamate kinase n=1 Tax=Halalkalibacter sp. APA_J-10(15) TaxID=2933805 RepID=UPI001FF5336B|nr:acetylglutamate kinase [Halalkalibacter sp. APA_J-10(15)]
MQAIEHKRMIGGDDIKVKDIVVIKCGGSTISELSDAFFKSVVQMKNSGKYPIVVHGGGPMINQLLQKLEIKSEFVDGLRKTTEDVLETAEMVLCGRVNKQLVTNIQLAGGLAIGLSGCDAKLIEVKPINEGMLGFVGEPIAVNTSLLNSLLEQDMIPVIAPIGINKLGKHYNVNADSAAGAIAKALQADQLVFVTDVDGILKDGECLQTVVAEEIEEMVIDGTIYGGMIPKVNAALATLADVESVMIMNGKDTTIQEDGSIKGTVITKSHVQTHV